MDRRYLALGLVLVLLLTACEKIALINTSQKKPQISKTQLASQAKRYFWQIFYHGQYQNISTADYLLMAAYLQNPNDAKLAAYLGFLHLWSITERAKAADKFSPLITNQVILAKKYFADALQLEPNNPIYQGFYGDTQLIEGKIFKDQREQVKGYFTLKRAIQHWPEFNYFTAGYTMSILPPDSAHFKEGLEWQWQTLDLCAGQKVNRKNPDYRRFMNREINTGAQRVCWNTPLAPHNYEGFFMNMGDMLVKAGDPTTGIKIYRNAKLAKNYSQWPYKKNARTTY